MKLNPGQELAVSKSLHAIFESPDDAPQGYTIIGEGGTGKTFSVTEIVRAVLDEGHHVLFTAPTHKAVKQLQKSCRENDLVSDKLGFSTIHSALGLGLMPSEETKHVARWKESVLSDYALVVIDEASMLPKVMIENYLLPDLLEHGTFALLMGDDMQLPPVKENFSAAFGLYETSELTENQRQQANPDGTPNGILELARAIRPCIKENRVFKFDFAIPNNVTCVKDRDFLANVLEYFTLETDLEQTRVLAWRNFRVDDINRAIRKKIYGPDAARFELGERIVTGGSIKDLNDNVLLTTDEECIVKGIKDSQLVDKHNNKVWKTTLLTLEPCYAGTRQVFAHVVHESELPRYKGYLSELKQKALAADGSAKGLAWRRFHEFQELFGEIKYVYCTTVHRAQGSTYNVIFLDVKDILECPRAQERRKLLYVGASRPRVKLVINKTGFTA